MSREQLGDTAGAELRFNLMAHRGVSSTSPASGAAVGYRCRAAKSTKAAVVGLSPAAPPAKRSPSPEVARRWHLGLKGLPWVKR